jgi:hypothetical protein
MLLPGPPIGFPWLMVRFVVDLCVQITTAYFPTIGMVEQARIARTREHYGNPSGLIEVY